MQTTSYNNKKYYLFDTIEEFIKHVNGLKINRTINKLQVHHTYAPSYSNWKTDIELRRIRNTVDFHKKTFGSSDIAQHYTIFPNGKIATGRDINSTPIGIKGWNTNAICIEIYGDFDKGKDVMTKAQKEAVIALYGELCKKFKLTPSTSTIRPHCWFTAGGIYLGKYNSSRSAKTCPGTNFMGYGCSPSGFAKFINEVKAYVNGKEASKEEAKPAPFKQYIAKPTVDGLVGRKGPGVEYDKVTLIDTDIAVTIIGEEKAKDGGTWLKCKAGYYVNKKYMKFVRYV